MVNQKWPGRLPWKSPILAIVSFCLYKSETMTSTLNTELWPSKCDHAVNNTLLRASPKEKNLELKSIVSVMKNSLQCFRDYLNGEMKESVNEKIVIIMNGELKKRMKQILKKLRRLFRCHKVWQLKYNWNIIWSVEMLKRAWISFKVTCPKTPLVKGMYTPSDEFAKVKKGKHK